MALLADEVDHAIAELSQAADLAPSNAAVWSDLAAAHLRRGEVATDPYELVLAAAAANHALHLSPDLLPARFNRALALERLSLGEQAAKEWRLVAERQRDPGWAREAKEHSSALARHSSIPSWTGELQALTVAAAQGNQERARAIVLNSRQRFREYLEETLLGQWALAVDKRQEGEAEKQLAVAQTITYALARAGNDRMATKVIDHLSRLRKEEPWPLRRLAEGLLTYRRGMDLAAHGESSRALQVFRKARFLLTEQRSPFAHWATFQIALCQYQSSNYRQAREQFLRLAKISRRRGYKALHGRCLWLIGLIDGIQGNLAPSLSAHLAAEADFRDLKEDANAAKLSSLLAINLHLLGRRKEAWHQLYTALHEPTSLGKPEIRFSICENASWLAQEEGDTEVALWFQNEVVRNAQLIGRPVAIVAALRWRAHLLSKLGKKAEAAKDLAHAWKYQILVPDPQTRQSIGGDIRLVEGEIAGAGKPENAIAALNPAIEVFRATSYYSSLSQALYLRALAEDKLERYDDEEHDLSAAIAESERQREKVTSPEERISYFDRTRELLDTMISFQLEHRHQPEAALHFSEEAKARVLWDWVLTQPGGGPDPKHLDQTRLSAADTRPLEPLEQNLPGGTTMIEYAVLPQSTVLWVLRRGVEPKGLMVKGGAGVLNGLVQKLHRALLDRRTADIETTSEKLYDTLLKPVARDLVPGERLVFVPDGALHALPFALLRDPRTRRYLVQDHVVSVAPSIRVLAASLRRDEALTRRSSPRALVIADPDFDRGLYPLLARLRSGGTETTIAQIFPGSLPLRDRDATRRAFLRSAGGFEIVHFGGHSVVNTEFPLLSQMIFATAPGDPTRGVLYSGDILRQRFPRTRLAVLASCATAAGRISRTEGVENLARPFLAAGVPAVVASLWNVDDEPTADFFVRFYQNLRKGWDVAGALRVTQADSIEHGSGLAASPRTWAAFEVIGGSVPE